MNIEEAFEVLQTAVKERYGDGFETEGGAGTIMIAHDRIEITNASNRYVADEIDGVTAELGRK